MTSARDSRASGSNPRAVFLRQIEDDGHGLCEHEVPVDEHRQLARGVEREKLGAAVVALHEVDLDEVERHAELLEGPDGADRAGGSETVDLHELDV